MSNPEADASRGDDVPATADPYGFDPAGPPFEPPFNAHEEAEHATARAAHIFPTTAVSGISAVARGYAETREIARYRKALADLREELRDRIDGAIETRGWDSWLSRMVEQIDDVLARNGSDRT